MLEILQLKPDDRRLTTSAVTRSTASAAAFNRTVGNSSIVGGWEGS